MENKERVTSLLDNIRQSEGSSFEFDEATIRKEYDKASGSSSSLIIKIIIVLGGTLATFSFFGFLIAAGLNDNSKAEIILGIILIGAGIFLNKKFDKLIIDTFSISTYGLGYLILGLGIDQFGNEDNYICLAFILLALISIAITKNYILVFVSVLIINGSILGLISINESFHFIHPYIFLLILIFLFWNLSEAKIISRKRISRLYDPVRIGLIFSLISALVYIGIRDLVPVHYTWIPSLITIPVILYLVSVTMKSLRIENRSDRIKIYIISTALLVSAFFAPAISGSMIIILLSYRVSHRTGVAIGIASVVYFIIQYFYDLHISLLAKSGVLFFYGMILLIIYLLTYKDLVKHE